MKLTNSVGFFNKILFNHLYILCTLSLLILSCSKNEFSVNKKQNIYSTNPISSLTSSSCSGFTLIKPEVDFLFLWDNTSSTFFINEQSKQALNNTIALISTRFNYHILMAPLVGSGNNSAYLAVENENGLSTSAKSMVVPQDQASQKLGTFPTSTVSAEDGLQRTYDLINNNRSNGIFRNKAYTIVVLMSNGDDIIFNGSNVDPWANDQHLYAMRDNFVYLRDIILQSEQFRFISLVSFSACQSGFRQNYTYKKMSGLIYNSKIPSQNDQNGRPYPDSYDICTTSFIHLFDGINDGIQSSLLAHIYDAWPISSSSGLTFNPSKIYVKKNTGAVIPEVSGPPGPGFKYLGYTTRNTRILPTPGEPFTGHLIELYGTSKVNYPECLVVTTETPVDYYGYVQLQTKPVISTIKLKINGVTISQSTVNGWDYIGYKENQNLKILGSNDYTPATPEFNKTGYILKVYGSAVYNNGAVIDVTYDPAGI